MGILLDLPPVTLQGRITEHRTQFENLLPTSNIEMKRRRSLAKAYTEVGADKGCQCSSVIMELSISCHRGSAREGT